MCIRDSTSTERKSPSQLLSAPARRSASARRCSSCADERAMSLMLRFAARSDVGLIRTNNEDAVYAGPRLVAVADGMGGHAAGDVASAVTIATLAPLDDDDPPSDLLGVLE